MKGRQTICTPYANIPSKAKPKKSPRKSLFQVNPTPTPDQRRFAKPRRANINKINLRSPHSLPNVLNNNRAIDWDSNVVKNLTTKAMETAQEISTTLTPMQGTQLVRTVSTPNPLNTVTEKPTEEMVEKQKKEEGATYCPICLPVGHECKGKLMPSE